MKKKLSHYDRSGRPAMVDVSAKRPTARRARAHAFVRMNPAVVERIRRSQIPKGDPLAIARIAGITAAKRTALLLPLCHPLPLEHIDVALELCENGVRLVSSVRSTAPTGVEMEALTAVAVGALTMYDMCKALDRSIEVQDIYLLEKTGGKRGPFRRRTR